MLSAFSLTKKSLLPINIKYIYNNIFYPNIQILSICRNVVVEQSVLYSPRHKKMTLKLLSYTGCIRCQSKTREQQTILVLQFKNYLKKYIPHNPNLAYPIVLCEFKYRITICNRADEPVDHQS